MYNATTGVPTPKSEASPHQVWNQADAVAEDCVAHYIDDGALMISVVAEPWLKIFGTCVHCHERYVAMVCL